MERTEAQTRRELIDQNIELAGWDRSDASQVIEELEIDLVAAGQASRASEPRTPYEGFRFSDYALIHQGKPAAVIEAKRSSKDAELGKEQALQYAESLQKIHGGAKPFIFYTNGYDTYFWDSDFYPPEKVIGFPTRADLDWMVQRRDSRRPLSVEMINTSIAGRDYQIGAIRSILEEAEHQRKRKFLLVLATGTGKTRTATALFDVFLRARWAKRILFLVDRVALRDQALDAFKEHVPSEPRWPADEYRKEAFDRSRRIYVSTYPTMLHLIEKGTTPSTWMSPFFFDVIVADESHRSIYNVYSQVLSYFSAIKIGLTATPRSQITHQTFSLFDCPTGQPTYGYSYEEAVANEPPYLCDFEVLNVRTKFQVEGISQQTVEDDDQEQLQLAGFEPEEIEFEGTDIEKKVVNADTNALIVREFMEESIKDPTGTLPGKSIIFAVSKDHAKRLVNLFDRLYPEHKGKLARRMVHGDSRVHGKGGLLDQFRTEDFPRVAISVDMLDTGVDVREIVNLVFAKPVMSHVKFWQMIGRGTRVLEENPSKRKPWCPEKDRFLIIDCWGNFERFKMNPKGKEPGLQTALPVRLFISRLNKLEAAQAANKPDIVDAVITDLRADLATLPKNNVLVLENQEPLERVFRDEFWRRLRPHDLDFLRKIIAPLMRARSSGDMKGLRFIKETIDLSCALLAEEHEQVSVIRQSIIDQVSELATEVNEVQREIGLIDQIVVGDYLDQLDDGKVSKMAMRLSPLMKHRAKRNLNVLRFDLRDLVSEKGWIEFGPEQARMTLSAYREKLENHVKALVDSNPVLMRLKEGEDVSDADIHELARLLGEQDPYATEEMLRKIYDHKKARFIQFIRHIIGLEELGSWFETVSNAFDAFISEHNTLTSIQIRFLQTLKTFILQNGRMTKGDLIAAPFTQIHPRGIRGVFEGSQAKEVIDFAEQLVA